MPNDIDRQVLALLQAGLHDSLANLFDAEADRKYLEDKLVQIAEQATLALASSGEKREEHELNIRHLTATIESEATARYLKLYSQGQEAFIAVLKGLIKLIVPVLLSV